VRSANRYPVAVPRFRLNTNGHRALSVTDPMAWNSLPDFIRNPTSSTDCFRRLLKRTCSRDTNASLTLMSYKSTQSHRHAHHNTTAPQPEVKLQKAMFKNTYFTFFQVKKSVFWFSFNMRGSKGGRTGRAPPLFVGRNIFNTYHFCTGLEVRRYTPVQLLIRHLSSV